MFGASSGLTQRLHSLGVSLGEPGELGEPHKFRLKRSKLPEISPPFTYQKKVSSYLKTVHSSSLAISSLLRLIKIFGLFLGYLIFCKITIGKKYRQAKAIKRAYWNGYDYRC